MKANDLMIGDIIAVNNTPLQISALGTTKAGFIDAKGEMFYHYYDNIEPIPLTAEILERNGFVDCNTIGEKFELRIYLDKDNYRVISYYFATKGLSIKTEYSYSIRPTIEELRIKYVQELQHALKLCGIGKEIEI